MFFIQPNNKSQVSVCVCSPTIFLLLYKIDIMRKHVLILALNQPRKVLSSFHIRKMGINQIYLTIQTSWGIADCLRDTTFSQEVSEGVSFPPRFNDHPKQCCKNYKLKDIIFTQEVSEGVSFPPRVDNVSQLCI